ncbi:MAG: class I SAM-dependent methyltransferase [Alphaproteobacteria bacterium]|nr:class I SAM-dependent methyltransferase [Alphaproteobacteria bacterium]
MSGDQETLAAYNARAADYVRLVSRSDPDEDLQAFLDALGPGGRVLDLGCGPGNSAAMMQARGFEVEAIDASPEMARIALETYGIAVQNVTFDTLSATARYDGIWANFSLLHESRADLPGHIARIRTALRGPALFHIGMKTGSGSGRDRLGRFYTYYTEDELVDLLAAEGLVPIRTRRDRAVGLSGTHEPFVVILARAGA